jgi:hypothetical protein
MRELILALAIVNGVVWYGLITAPGLHHPDTVCPVEQRKIRYPKHLADFHDGEGRMKHYRIASCKPTGIDWRR